MVIQTELGLLRRTHYSVQLHEASGKSATVMGWISAVRGHGNISFVTIRDNNFGKKHTIALVQSPHLQEPLVIVLHDLLLLLSNVV